MIPALGAEQVLQTLAGFKEYATTGTLLVLELVGTFVFALSGATAGVKHRLDLFGVLVLSFATATAGGITRDVLIGAVPPAALRDWLGNATGAAIDPSSTPIKTATGIRGDGREPLRELRAR